MKIKYIIKEASFPNPMLKIIKRRTETMRLLLSINS